MKKKFMSLAVLSLFAVSLASCTFATKPTNPASQTTPTATEPGTEQSRTLPAVEEVNEAPFNSIKLMYGDKVYAFDKTNKKVVVTKYNNYSEYKSNSGTKLFEESVKYIKYDSTTNGVYFVNDNRGYTIYQDGTSYKMLERTTTGYSSHGLKDVTNIVEPVYGSFKCETKFEKYKADAQGNRIPNGDGGYQKEDFYAFLELTETSAKFFVSDNPNTHGDTPLHSVNNYVLELIGGRVTIHIPHQNGDFNVSISFDDDGVHFINSSENNVDHGCSGRFVKVE